jgi:hypothetical protein
MHIIKKKEKNSIEIIHTNVRVKIACIKDILVTLNRKKKETDEIKSRCLK